MTTAKRDGHILVTVEHGQDAQSVNGTLDEVPSRVLSRPLAGTHGHIGRASEVGWAAVGPRHDVAANMITLDTDDDSS